MKFRAYIREEQGQTLIYVTFAMLLLLAMVALAIDGAYVYAERRRMQNAADAGALAGAQELCLNRTEDQARDKAYEYAYTRNGVDLTNRNTVNEPAITVDMSKGLVTVAISETARLFLAPAVGMPQMNVPAIAAAACDIQPGEAPSGCGLWPIAFAKNKWQDMLNRGMCGKTFYVWTGEHASNAAAYDKISGLACAAPDAPAANGAAPKPTRTPVPPPTDTPIPGASPTPTPPAPEATATPEWGPAGLCSVCNCDTDNDGEDDVLTDMSRAWLDFSGATDPLYPDTCSKNGCGTSELACWVEKGEGGRIVLPACVSGDDGGKTSLDSPVTARKGQNIAVPLFDSIDCSPTSGNCPTGPNAHSYHITDFGCVQADPSDPFQKNFVMTGKGTPYPAPHGGSHCAKVNLIAVRFNCDQNTCNTGCGTGGTDPDSPHVNAVRLVPVQ